MSKTEATTVFKIGDRVRVVFLGDKKFGKKGVVTELKKYGVSVTYEDDSQDEWAYASSLELLPPLVTPTLGHPTGLSHAERKQRPVLTGVLDYFPDACMEVAYGSLMATEQHHPGSKMHWDRDKSIGEGNELVRHLMDRKKHRYDTDGVRTLAKAAWRALELLQRDIEAEQAEIKAAMSASAAPMSKIETGKLMSSGRSSEDHAWLRN